MKQRLQQRPMSSPPPFPPLLLVLLLLHLPSLTLAQGSDPASDVFPLSPSNIPYTAEVSLEHGKNRSFTVTLPEASHLLAEFVILRPSPLADWVAEGPPSLLLTAAVSPAPALVATTGTAFEADYNCTQTNPCLRKGDGTDVDVDDEAFFTRSERAAVRLKGLKKGATVVVEVHNFDRKYFLEDGEKVVEPGMKGRVRMVAIAQAEEMQCPGYVDPKDGEEEGKVCSARGSCENGGNCKCESDFGGPLCELEVLPVETLEPVDEPSYGWPIPPIAVEDGGFTVSVPAFTRRVFSWTQREGNSRVYVEARVLSGFAPDGTEGAAVSDTRVRMFVKTPGENGNVFLEDGPLLPSEYDLERQCERFGVKPENYDPVFIFKCYRKDVVKKETNLLIAIYANTTGGDERKPPRNAVVSFRVFRCDVDDVPCPPDPNSINATISIPIAVLPVCVATIGITALAIGIMLWLDRQHGFTSSVDRLSQKELDRMYPTKKFHLPQEPRMEGSGGQETDECLICLSKFEENEIVRRLHCEHIYHSECLDVSFAPAL